MESDFKIGDKVTFKDERIIAIMKDATLSEKQRDLKLDQLGLSPSSLYFKGELKICAAT